MDTNISKSRIKMKVQLQWQEVTQAFIFAQIPSCLGLIWTDKIIEGRIQFNIKWFVKKCFLHHVCCKKMYILPLKIHLNFEIVCGTIFTLYIWCLRKFKKERVIFSIKPYKMIWYWYLSCKNVLRAILRAIKRGGRKRQTDRQTDRQIETEREWETEWETDSKN